MYIIKLKREFSSFVEHSNTKLEGNCLHIKKYEGQLKTDALRILKTKLQISTLSNRKRVALRRREKLEKKTWERVPSSLKFFQGLFQVAKRKILNWNTPFVKPFVIINKHFRAFAKKILVGELGKR